MNYFELFDLPHSPVIDKSLLAKKYVQLQKKNHPDFFTNAEASEKEEALEQSAAVNKAYNIFRDEDKTIHYFLETMGVVINDEKYTLPPDFLMEMMEINEELTEDNSAARQKVKDYEDKLYETVAATIKGYENPGASGHDMLKLKDYYYKKKYLKRILERLGD